MPTNVFHNHGRRRRRRRCAGDRGPAEKNLRVRGDGGVGAGFASSLCVCDLLLRAPTVVARERRDVVVAWLNTPVGLPSCRDTILAVAVGWLNT